MKGGYRVASPRMAWIRLRSMCLENTRHTVEDEPVEDGIIAKEEP